METLNAYVVKYGIGIVAGIVILLVGWSLAGWAGRLVRRYLLSRDVVDRTYVPLAENLVRYSLLALAVIVVLDQFGVEITSIIAVLGTIGVAIALAVQGTLSNLAAGIMILALRPIRVGDDIEAEGNAGVVYIIGLFLTTIHTKDGTAVTLPNALLWTKPVKNHSRDHPRRLDIELSVSEPKHLAPAKEHIRALIAAEKSLRKNPAPSIETATVTDKKAAIAVRVWTRADDPQQAAWRFARDWQQSLVAGGMAKAPADDSEGDAKPAPKLPAKSPSSSLPAPPPRRRKTRPE